MILPEMSKARGSDQVHFGVAKPLVAVAGLQTLLSGLANMVALEPSRLSHHSSPPGVTRRSTCSSRTPSVSQALASRRGSPGPCPGMTSKVDDWALEGQPIRAIRTEVGSRVKTTQREGTGQASPTDDGASEADPR